MCYLNNYPSNKIKTIVNDFYQSYKFKARTRQKGNLLKAIADDLNSLDGFKVDGRAVRKLYGVSKAHSEVKEKSRRFWD